MNNLMQFHDKFWNESCLVIAQMEARGVALDIDYLERKRELALEEVAELEQRLDRWAYDYIRQTDGPMNWASPKQLTAFLYHFKCYPIPPVKGSLNATKRNNKREETTAEAGLDWLARNTKSDVDREMLTVLLRARKTSKLAQFMASLCSAVSAHDGRLRSSFGPNTDTGRLSSSNPNLQNIPTRNDRFGIRKAFVAAPGKLLVVADYSQLEMYVIAHFLIHVLDDHSLARDLSTGDVHSAMAFRIWPAELAALGATPENIKDVAKSYRGNAKTVNYAVPYGKTAAGLGSQIKGTDGKGIGKKAAQDILDDYFEACPGLGTLFERWENEARQTGYVRTLLGRTRPLPGAASDDVWEQRSAFRRAVNTPVQGSAADIVTAAMLACVGAGPTLKQKAPARQLANLGAKMLMQVHDELMFEVPEENAEEARGIIQSIMENPFDKPLKVQLTVDAEIGKSWGECK